MIITRYVSFFQATLEMKGGKEMKALLDILALDSSIYARIQVGIQSMYSCVKLRSTLLTFRVIDRYRPSLPCLENFGR